MQTNKNTSVFHVYESFLKNSEDKQFYAPLWYHLVLMQLFWVSSIVFSLYHVFLQQFTLSRINRICWLLFCVVILGDCKTIIKNQTNTSVTLVNPLPFPPSPLSINSAAFSNLAALYLPGSFYFYDPSFELKIDNTRYLIALPEGYSCENLCSQDANLQSEFFFCKV